MFKCKCGKEYEKQSSLNSHARFCNLYEKKVKRKISINYKLSEDLYECECKKQFNNPISLGAHFSHCIIHKKEEPLKRKSSKGKMLGWDKFTQDELKKIKIKSGKSYTENIKNGKIIPHMLGKNLSIESKQKISNKMKENNNGITKTKWFSIFSSYDNKNINVQGTWEYKFAEYLNKNNILWTRYNKTFDYKNHENDFIHKYTPDFYLIETDEYIEVKGYWWKSKNGRVDDKRKMLNVIEQNKDYTFKIFLKEDLKILGVL